MIPKKYEQVLVSLFLSGIMSAVFAGLAVVAGRSTTAGWLPEWLLAWGFAFAVVLVAGPIAREAASRLVR